MQGKRLGKLHYNDNYDSIWVMFHEWSVFIILFIGIVSVLSNEDRLLFKGNKKKTIHSIGKQQ